MRNTLKRVICPYCQRSVAVHWDGFMFDHNPVKNGGGALFTFRRFTGNGLCPGSNKHASDVVHHG